MHHTPARHCLRVLETEHGKVRSGQNNEKLLHDLRWQLTKVSVFVLVCARVCACVSCHNSIWCNLNTTKVQPQIDIWKSSNSSSGWIILYCYVVLFFVEQQLNYSAKGHTEASLQVSHLCWILCPLSLTLAKLFASWIRNQLCLAPNCHLIFLSFHTVSVGAEVNVKSCFFSQGKLRTIKQTKKNLFHFFQNFGLNTNISTTNGWSAMKFCADSHGHQGFILNHEPGSVTFSSTVKPATVVWIRI